MGVTHRTENGKWRKAVSPGRPPQIRRCGEGCSASFSRDATALRDHKQVMRGERRVARGFSVATFPVENPHGETRAVTLPELPTSRQVIERTVPASLRHRSLTRSPSHDTRRPRSSAPRAASRPRQGRARCHRPSAQGRARLRAPAASAIGDPLPPQLRQQQSEGGGLVERRRPRSMRARTPQHRSSRLLRHRAQRVPGGQSHILRTFSTTAHWVTGGVVVSEAVCALWAGGQKQHEMLLSYVPHVAGRGREAWSGGGDGTQQRFFSGFPLANRTPRAHHPPPPLSKVGSRGHVKTAGRGHWPPLHQRPSADAVPLASSLETAPPPASTPSCRTRPHESARRFLLLSDRS